jgi:acyl-CoA synthetase (AMP-forming)/AMP-acid ligase II
MTKYSERTLARIIAAKAESEPDSAAPPIVGAPAGSERTYGQLWGKGQCLAAGLTKLGVAAGDRIALLLADRPEAEDTYVACSLLGATVVPIDATVRGDALARVLAAGACRGAIAAEHALAAIGDVRERVPTLRWVLGVATGDGRRTPAQFQASGVRPYAEVAAADPAQCRFAGSQPDDAMQIVYAIDASGAAVGSVTTHRRHCETMALAPGAVD